MNQDLKEFESNFQGFELRFTRIEVSLKGFDLRFDTIEANIERFDLRFERIEVSFQGFKLKFERLQFRCKRSPKELTSTISIAPPLEKLPLRNRLLINLNEHTASTKLYGKGTRCKLLWRSFSESLFLPSEFVITVCLFVFFIVFALSFANNFGRIFFRALR